MSDSDLYLRYIIGEVEAAALPVVPERHIRCNPVLAQFIVSPEFESVPVDGPFDKQNLDPADVGQREDFVTRGWQRLQRVRALGVSLGEYPLPEVRDRKN